MSLYAFHIGQIISTVLGQVDHGGQDSKAARTRIRDEKSETDHTQKRRLRHNGICRTITAFMILRCLYGSEMVLLGVVIRKCEAPATNISQENCHGILMITCQIVAYQQWTYFSFFPESFLWKHIGIYLSILFLIWCKIVNIGRSCDLESV